MTNSFITEFDEKFNVIRNIQSNKIDISQNTWKIKNAKIYKKNDYIKDCPSVNLSGIALKRLDYALTNELKYYENRKFL